MKLLRYCTPLYFLVALMFVMPFLLLSPTAFTRTKQTKGSANEPVVILDVQQNAGTIYISPVALFERGQFNPPYSKINGDLPRRRFVEKYFSSGQKYHLIFGSGDAGTLTITNGYWQDGSYAYGELAPVAAVGGRIKGQLHALATNSETPARSSIWRRSPTADERAAAMPAQERRDLFVLDRAQSEIVDADHLPVPASNRCQESRVREVLVEDDHLDSVLASNVASKNSAPLSFFRRSASSTASREKRPP